MPDLAGLENAMRLPRLALLLFGDQTEIPVGVSGWQSRVDVYTVPAALGLAAMLVRRDGYVAWAADEDSSGPGMVERSAVLARCLSSPYEASARAGSKSTSRLGQLARHHPATASVTPFVPGRFGTY
jgi:hypothetical protein